MYIQKKDKITIGNSNDVMVVNGECPNCKRGRHSLILVHFIHSNSNTPGEGTVFIKCMACTSLFQTKVKNVAD